MLMPVAGSQLTNLAQGVSQYQVCKVQTSVLVSNSVNGTAAFLIASLQATLVITVSYVYLVELSNN